MSIRTYSKGQSVEYQYKKTGSFALRMSDNISALGIQSDKNFIQLESVENFNKNLYKIREDGFKNCTNLKSVNFSQVGIDALSASSFENCVSLSSLILPTSIRDIGEKCFKNCAELKILSFRWHDEEMNDSGVSLESQLTAFGEEALAGCSNIDGIAFPTSINDVSKIDPLALKDSAVNRVIFLGLPSSEIETIASSKVFGLSRDCILFTSDQKKYKYSAQTESVLEEPEYDPYGTLKTPTAGRTAMKKFFRFSSDVIKWCIDPSSRSGKDAQTFPQVPCPVIVAYCDLKTSVISQKFLENVILDSQFQKQLKSQANCYLFLLSRNGIVDVGSTADPDLAYFRSTLNAGKQIQKPFVSLNFYYKDYFSTTTTTSTNPHDILNLILEGSQRTGFKDFDAEPFDLKLEEPYVETVPTTTPKAKSGYTPWWWNGSSVQSVSEWSI